MDKVAFSPFIRGAWGTQRGGATRKQDGKEATRGWRHNSAEHFWAWLL